MQRQHDTEADIIKKFTLSFFDNLKCKSEWDGKVLTVSEIPKSFEDFCGRKGPLKIVFEEENEVDGAELVAKGAFLLKTMANYLENMGQTTLLKINFDLNIEGKIRNFYNFHECDIFNLKKSPLNSFITRFSFLTSFQYLNEKEQILNDVYVENGNVFDFDISKFNVVDGNKNEIEVGDVKRDYKVAKEYLRLILESKIDRVGKVLNEKLEKEVKRIGVHYDNHLAEVNESINKNMNQMIELERQIVNSGEKERIVLNAKIERVKEIIKKLEKNDEYEKLKMEKEFFINDEIRKHGLNIDNKLINTTIIYYNKFNVSFMIRNSDAGSREISFVYDPLIDNIEVLKCESCNSELNSIRLCSSGHISCFRCLWRCIDCGRECCKNCRTGNCVDCGKRACKKCLKKCIGCGKIYCKSHIRKQVFKERCSGCFNANR